PNASRRSTPTGMCRWTRTCSTGCRASASSATSASGSIISTWRRPRPGASRSATPPASSTAPPRTWLSPCCWRPGGAWARAPETHGLIGRAELARMKPTASLVNVARGPVVDNEALTEALAARRLHAAALDVTDPEPLPRDHPLLRLDNVIITPHLGSATEQTRRRMVEVSVENLLAGLSGRPLLFRVVAPGAPQQG